MDPPAEPAEPAQCAVHPDRVANAGVCPRCGTFTCTECRVPTDPRNVCATCDARLDRGMAGRIQPLAIAMMVHGGLLVTGGAFALVYGLAIGGALMSMPQPADVSGQGRLVEAIMVWGVVGEGVLHLLIGALQGWAGWRIRTYRNRGLAIAALLAGGLTVLGCYCAPTSIGLMIWGMIVLLQSSVAERFASPARAGRGVA